MLEDFSSFVKCFWWSSPAALLGGAAPRAVAFGGRRLRDAHEATAAYRLRDGEAVDDVA
jgi:hypothetical protein